MRMIIIDGIVKSRHSRENGNPENSNYMKILDSCLRRNERQWPFQTFYETIIIRIIRYHSPSWVLLSHQSNKDR